MPIFGFEMKKIFKFSPSIITIFLLLMLPAFIALISFVYISNDKIANSISNRLIERFKFETELSVIDQINPTRSLINSAAEVGSINPQFFNKDESWKYLKSILSQQETSMSAYAGGQDGSFRQVRRLKAGGKIQNIAITEEMKFGLRWIPKDRSSDSYIFIDNLNEKIGTSVTTTDYDPRTRPWYKEAASKNKLIITDPYIFSTTGLPGVTVAAPFFDKNSLAGVVAVDISLETISEFLLSNSVSKRSISVIYDSMGIVIASSEKKDTFKSVNNLKSIIFHL